MKKALILSLQPPGSNGVQARRYSKLLPFVEEGGWEFHFVGPDPSLDCLFAEPAYQQDEFCHYTRKIVYSRQCAIQKNKQKKGSVAYYWYAFQQLIHRWIENLFSRDSMSILAGGMMEKAISVNKTISVDLIAAICPDFRILEVGHDLSVMLNKPFLAIYDDPFGHREAGKFYPAEYPRQQRLLDHAVGAVFASPLTRDRYQQAGLLETTASEYIPDCFSPSSLFLSSARQQPRHPQIP